MIILEKRIEYKYGEILKIKPIFDIHYGNSFCDKRKFIDFIEDRDENTYYFGGGDLLDSISVTDPRYRKSSDNTIGDDIIDQQINGMIDMLMPIKDKIIGIGSGNHEDVITKRSGTNPTKRMCKELETEFLGYSGLIRLVLSENKSRIRTVIIRWHHGWGGGSRTQGADLTKFSKDMLYWDADVFLYSHVHRKQSDRIPRLGLSGKKLIAKPMLLGICGTFLKTYSETGDPSYSEVKGYPPTELGGLTLNIKPSEKWVKYWIDV